jgi:hypothetical protein
MSLTKAFNALRKNGYFARQNFMCCQTCEWAAVPEKNESKVVFYHSQDNDNKKQVTISDLEKIKKQIFRIKERNWREEQLKLNKTSNTGEGTRRRLSNEASNEIDNILNKNNIEIINDLNINEDIIRIKTLILY